ncbi:unnamed protein product [Cercospora beticola]|nr:unnamed protein product [Cercospora beticola]
MAAQNKPTFGPLETPAVFASKWLRRFEKHFLSLGSYDFRIDWTDWMSKSFELYLAFTKQSDDMGFSREMLSTVSVTSGDFFHTAEDVWRTAEGLREWVNWSLEEEAQSMQASKNYTRQEKIKFDDLMDKITLATVAGTWNGEVSQESSEKLEWYTGRFV